MKQTAVSYANTCYYYYTTINKYFNSIKKKDYLPSLVFCGNKTRLGRTHRKDN